MHLEIEINKEILDYETQVASGLSARKFFALIGAIIVSVIINFTIGKHLPQMLTMVLYVVGIFPFFVIGFVSYNGLVGEQVVTMIRDYMVTPKKLPVSCNNFYEKCLLTNEKGKEKKETEEEKNVRKKERRNRKVQDSENSTGHHSD